MDWVHCNCCFTQPGDVDMKKFFITNCGHIYCDECLQMNQSKECRICQIKYSTIPLTSNMTSEVEVYFHDPVVNLKKQIKILEFQQSHRVRLVSHNKDRIKNYKILKKENFNLTEELKLFKQENAVLREEIKHLKNDLLQFKKKLDYAKGIDNQPRSQPVSRMHSFSQFLNKEILKSTPINSFKNRLGSNERLSGGQTNLENKRQLNPNFFVVSESQRSREDGKIFTTPDLPRFPGSYRSSKLLTPDVTTPSTPESITRILSQKDPLQKKIKIPGSQGGPSSATKIGFQGLTLSRPTSTPCRNSLVTNKYLKYFK